MILIFALQMQHNSIETLFSFSEKLHMNNMEIIWSNYIIFETWSNFQQLSKLNRRHTNVFDIFLDTDNSHWQILHSNLGQGTEGWDDGFFIC